MSAEREESGLPGVDDGFRRYCSTCESWSACIYRCEYCEVKLQDSDPMKQIFAGGSA